MGCWGWRTRITKEEEQGIVNNEIYIGFSLVDIELADLVIRKWSWDHQLNDRQFEQVWVDLKINPIVIQDMNTASPELKRRVTYFKQLKKNDVFSEYQMLILAAFYCSGTAKDKARVLFENADPSRKGMITRKQFDELWADVCKILVDNVEVLASGRTEQGQVNPNVLNSYLASLRAALPRATIELANRTFETPAMQVVVKQDFVERLGECSWLFVSYGFRKFLYDTFISKPYSPQKSPKKI